MTAGVLAWQLVILATIEAAHAIWSPTAARNVAIFWSLWTLYYIFASWLIVLQLGVTWWGYFAFGKSKSLQTFRDRRTVPVAPVQGSGPWAPSTSVGVIRSGEHRAALGAALEDARFFVGICSGWLTSRVVDAELIRVLRDAIRRHVRIHVVFGSENPARVHEQGSSGRRAERALRELAAASAEEPGSLFLTRIPSHEKRVIVDDRYIMIGSNNWLSSPDNRNSERSYRTDSPALAAAERRAMESLQHA